MKNLFPGYYRPTDDQFRKNFEEGVFCFDTNVLLNLYRFTASSRDELLSILQHEKIKDRVWLPHQVALEYHENRIGVILEQVGSYDRIWKFLENAVADAEKSRPLRHFHLAELTDSVRKALEKVKTDLDVKRDAHPNLLESDPILDCLTSLFDGRVGKPFDADALKKAIVKSKERFESRRPPGFLDSEGSKKKEGERKYGDALLWLQLLDHAKETKRSMILVTDETGEDWWNIQSGKKQGPRPELIQEMHDEAGCSFYMYSTEQFLKYSKEFLAVDIKQEVIKEAQAIETEDESAREDDKLTITPPLILTKGDVAPSELNLQRAARRAVKNAELRNEIFEKACLYGRAREWAEKAVRDYAEYIERASNIEEFQRNMRRTIDAMAANDALSAAIIKMQKGEQCD